MGNPSITILYHIIIRPTFNIFFKTLLTLQKDTKVGFVPDCSSAYSWLKLTFSSSSWRAAVYTSRQCRTRTSCPGDRTTHLVRTWAGSNVCPRRGAGPGRPWCADRVWADSRSIHWSLQHLCQEARSKLLCTGKRPLGSVLLLWHDAVAWILANGSAAFIESCTAIGWNSCDCQM